MRISVPLSVFLNSLLYFPETGKGKTERRAAKEKDNIRNVKSVHQNTCRALYRLLYRTRHTVLALPCSGASPVLHSWAGEATDHSDPCLGSYRRCSSPSPHGLGSSFQGAERLNTATYDQPQAGCPREQTPRILENSVQLANVSVYTASCSEGKYMIIRDIQKPKSNVSTPLAQN